MRLTYLTYAILCACLLGLAGCSDDQQSQDATPNTQSDREALQAALNEIQARWRCGDKSVLYEHELPYLREVMSFDEYLERKEIMPLEADSMIAMNLTDAEFFGRDSVVVAIEVVFVGLLGDTSRLSHQSTFFNYNDTWLRPSISHPIQQRKHDEIRRVADSAAAAEENEVW